MNLHNMITELPYDYEDACEERETAFDAYRDGHRAAIREAAELAIQADRRIEELEEALKAAKQYVIQTDEYGRSYSDDVLAIINKALGEHS